MIVEPEGIRDSVVFILFPSQSLLLHPQLQILTTATPDLPLLHNTTPAKITSNHLAVTLLHFISSSAFFLFSLQPSTPIWTEKPRSF